MKFRVDVERRIEGARKVGAHKTSMLQDLETDRPMEIDPLVTVVQERGRLTQIPTPAIDAVLAPVIQRAKVAELYWRSGTPLPRHRTFSHDPAAPTAFGHDGHLSVATASCRRKNGIKRGQRSESRERQ